MRQNLDLFGDMLDTFNPRRVIALAMIDGNTPVRRDTQVGLEFQGLTGIAVRRPCLHELIDLAVGSFSAHRSFPLVRTGNIGTTFGRDTFLKPANRLTSGSASL